jgi:hypothetical protein
LSRAYAEDAAIPSPVSDFSSLDILNCVSRLFSNRMEAFHHSLVAFGESPQGMESSLLRHLTERKCAPEPNLLAGVFQRGEQHFVRSLAMAMCERFGCFTPDESGL